MAKAVTARSVGTPLRVQSTQARQAKRPAAETAKGEQTKPVWSGKSVSRSNPILRTAVLSDHVELPKFTQPATVVIRTNPHEKTIHRFGDGSSASLEAGGKSLSINGRMLRVPPEVQETRQLFALETANGADNMPGRLWDVEYEATPISQAGNLMSVRETVLVNMGQRVAPTVRHLTVDATTGKPVSLDQLLTRRQYDSALNAIRSRLPTMKPFRSADGLRVSGKQLDTSSLEEIFNQNFALSRRRDGGIDIHSVIPYDASVSGVFKFTAPNDTLFSASTGLTP